MIYSELPVYDILDQVGNEFVRDLGGRSDIILLVGSKISEWYPSNAPSGMETTRQIEKLLASQFPSEEEQKGIAAYISRAPFEYVLDRCPCQGILRGLLAEVYRVSTSNLGHKAIASELR